MYSEILFYNPEDISKRSFVHTYINGKRWRFYNGSRLGITCFPNRCTNILDRRRELKRIEHCLKTKLCAGWFPENQSEGQDYNTVEGLNLLKEIVSSQNYSDVYKRDLTITIDHFLKHIHAQRISGYNLSQIGTKVIENYLLQFNSSGTYYMNKRRFLSTCFSKLVNLGYCTTNPVKKSTKRKVKAVLNEPYTPQQIVPVLDFLKTQNPHLYLCALLMYGTLLRPHQEIRHLRKKDFTPELDCITLDGYRNKSGSIRKAPVADYVKQALLFMKVDLLEADQNIFTRTAKPFNQYYFSLMWNRCKKKMLDIKLITSKQTLYSFRHSAAINVFTRSQNLHMIQSMFQHSNLSVSLTYLRSIGQDKMFDHKDLPRLSSIES